MTFPLPPALRPWAVAALVAAAWWIGRTQPVSVRLDRGTISIAPQRATPGAAQPSEAVVQRVIDGDTIELADGRLVRYIGVDTPEVRRRVGGRWVSDPEPMGEEASAFNRRMVAGKVASLEYDVQPTDRYGRLLAYVRVGGVFINAELLREGYAQTLTIPPNVRYVEEFRALANEARQARRGLWSRDRR